VFQRNGFQRNDFQEKVTPLTGSFGKEQKNPSRIISSFVRLVNFAMSRKYLGLSQASGGGISAEGV
jgi:hypothetical protein